MPRLRAGMTREKRIGLHKKISRVEMLEVEAEIFPNRMRIKHKRVCDIIRETMGILDFETPQETTKRKGREEAEKKIFLKRFYLAGWIAIFIILAASGFGLYAGFINPKLGERIGFGKTAIEFATMKRTSSCVVVDEPHCKGLVFQSGKDNDLRLPRVGVKVPAGTSVYAPFDGYFDYGARADDGGDFRSVIFVYREGDRTREGVLRGDYPRVSYIAPEWDYKRSSNEPVKRGDLIAVVLKEGGMFKSVVGENEINLLVNTSKEWSDLSGSKINSPLEYLKAFINYIEQKPLK